MVASLITFSFRRLLIFYFKTFDNLETMFDGGINISPFSRYLDIFVFLALAYHLNSFDYSYVGFSGFIYDLITVLWILTLGFHRKILMTWFSYVSILFIFGLTLY